MCWVVEAELNQHYCYIMFRDIGPHTKWHGRPLRCQEICSHQSELVVRSHILCWPCVCLCVTSSVLCWETVVTLVTFCHCCWCLFLSVLCIDHMEGAVRLCWEQREKTSTLAFSVGGELLFRNVSLFTGILVFVPGKPMDFRMISPHDTMKTDKRAHSKCNYLLNPSKEAWIYLTGAFPFFFKKYFMVCQ